MAETSATPLMGYNGGQKARSPKGRRDEAEAVVDWSVGVGIKRAAEMVALTRHLNNYYAQTVLVSHVLTRWDPLPRAPVVSNMRTAVLGSPLCILETPRPLRYVRGGSDTPSAPRHGSTYG